VTVHDSGVGPAPPAAVREERVRGLRARVAESGLDAFLTCEAIHLRYLAGFTGSSGCLLVTPDRLGLLTDSRYEEQAREELARDPVELRITTDGTREALARLVREWLLPGDGGSGEDAAPRVGIEDERLTVAALRRLREAVPEVGWEPAGEPVERLRAMKGSLELDRLRRAAAMAGRALESTLERVEEGMTERELVAELEYRIRTEGSGPPAFDSIVASGPRSALPHAEPSGRELREGDLLLLDLGATCEGYRSDVTRTVVLGPASEWQRDLHDAVRAAQRAAREAIAPGVEAREVDRRARETLGERGLADRFGHSTGHGVGLEVHEAPSLSRESDDILQEGHVVTVEPGAYLPGRGGVRIEDDVVVGRDGPGVLTDSPRELREL